MNKLPGILFLKIFSFAVCLIAFTTVCLAQTTEENATVIGEKILVPNAFSPNGDGVNDKLKIFVQNNVYVQSFVLFSRFGEKVFEATDASPAWDGTYKGIKSEAGTYVYMIAYLIPGHEGLFTKKGTVILIR